MSKKPDSNQGVRTPPKFCPGCGAKLRDTKKTRGAVAIGQPGGPNDAAELEPERPWGWDCYCASCGWSGDISPDEQFDDPPDAKKTKTPKKAKAPRKRAEPPAPPEHTWTDADRLTREEFEAGEPCRNCGRPFFGGPEWVATMHRTPEQAAAIEAEEAEFERLHPDCPALRWSVGGGFTHCARCCAPHPPSDEQIRQVARILHSARQRIAREKAAKKGDVAPLP
jgi:hypothetical protein